MTCPIISQQSIDILMDIKIGLICDGHYLGKTPADYQLVEASKSFNFRNTLEPIHHNKHASVT